MTTISVVLIAFALAFVGYTYVVYPALLGAWSLFRRERRAAIDTGDWPPISITVPAYNEAGQIRDTIASLLRIDYPEARRQILIVSDASTDGTDDIVAEHAGRGVELLRMPERTGKTAAENAARERLTGDIIINTDASIRIHPDAVKALVREFVDPSVGLASGRDISISGEVDDANVGESGYVGYEMWVRDLETRVGSIVGASGCFYAVRREVHEHTLPAGLSRDFAAAMVTRENGLRAVSVRDATCFVPRGLSLRQEYRRKVRTMVRGMGTLFFKRHLLNPLRHGRFAWMLFSHKVCRWLVPWAAVIGLVGLALAPLPPLLLAVVWGAAAAVVGLAWIGWQWPLDAPMPRVISLPAYALTANLAAMVAMVRTLRGQLDPVWEPTRRSPSTASAGPASFSP